jgi:hypothetical protein
LHSVGVIDRSQKAFCKQPSGLFKGQLTAGTQNVKMGYLGHEDTMTDENSILLSKDREP